MKFCVIGIGHYGYEVATTLTERGFDVLAIDRDENRIEKIRDRVAQSICINILDSNSLKAINIENIDCVIIGFGKNFADTAIITRILKKELEHPLVIARTNSDIKSEILNLIGADRIVRPEYYSALNLADNLSSPFPSTTRFNHDYSVVEFAAPSQFIAQSLAELDLLGNYQVHCVAVKRHTETLTATPDLVIHEHDTLFLAGENSNLKKLANL
ncbi:MAG TPA: TrkA family potassium uptake protein [Candidatus Babeliales bacterium]|nr:TrkA family potassium uptake protein [Candidatus Babeliales bacterium]